jgi:hypothetical protein
VLCGTSNNRRKFPTLIKYSQKEKGMDNNQREHPTSKGKKKIKGIHPKKQMDAQQQRNSSQ